MTLKPPVIFAFVLLVVAMLVAIAVFLPRGAEKLAYRSSTKVAGAQLRDCLGTGLGLGPWQGKPIAMRASKFGLRAAVSDTGSDRQVGLFTAGGQPLSGGQSEVVQACMTAK